LLAGRTESLSLAAAEPLLSIYRSVNTYPHLAESGLESSPVRIAPHDLGSDARRIVDETNAATVQAVRDLFVTREAEGRATTDTADAARAATFGAVDTLLVDMDVVVPGLVDETSGAVTFDKEASAASYGVEDEIACRVLTHGGRVLAVRREDIPQGATLAAILRYAV
jgi:hypothetical protein